MNQTKTFGPWAVLMTMMIGSLVFTCIGRAYAAASTADSSYVTYDLAAGTSSAAISPPSNKPVIVMGANTTPGSRGVGGVYLLKVPDNFLEWSGLNSTSDLAAAPTLTGGFSAANGTVICQIDWDGDVNLEVNNANTYVIVNSSSETETGQVTEIW
jgi:hypothetical protein